MRTYTYHGERSREDLWDTYDWAIMAAAARKPGKVTLKDVCRRFDVGKSCIQKRASRLRQAGLLVPRVTTFQLTRDGAWRWRKTGKWMAYEVFEQHCKPWFDALRKRKAQDEEKSCSDQ